MSPWEYLVRQFGHPSGPVGALAGWIMASRPSNRARIEWTIDLLALEPHHRVLELGFGPGYGIERVVQGLGTGEVVGIDHSRLMLAQALRRNAGAIAAGKARLTLGRVEALDALGGGFDRAFSSNVLQFCRDRDAVWRGIHAALKPGGQVATTFQPRHPGATDADALRFGEEMLGEMQRAGFVGERLERGPARPVLTVCALGARASG